MAAIQVFRGVSTYVAAYERIGALTQQRKKFWTLYEPVQEGITVDGGVG